MKKPIVIFFGPDPDGQGGMAAVCRALLGSELAESYDMRAIASHRVGSAASRVKVFGGGLRELRRQVKATDSPCIVHIHAASRGSLYRKSITSALAHRWGARVVIHVHTGPGEITEFADRIGPLRRGFLKRGLGRAEMLLSASEAGARDLASSFGLPAATVVYNAFPGPLPPAPPRSTRKGDVELLYLGGFGNPVKGGKILIDALSIVEQSGTSMAVTLAGDGDAPPESAAVGRWVGWLEGDDKAQALRRADIVAFPSTSEGLPVALLEAMAYGKAIVAARAGAIPEVIADGEEAVLVDTGDPPALAAAIVDLAASAPRRAALGRTARTRVADFSIGRVAGQLDTIYQDLLQGGPADG